MRPVALLLAVAVALSASPAVAEEKVPHRRGFLTGLGLGFVLLGGVGVGLGIGGTVNGVQAEASLAAIAKANAMMAPTGDDSQLLAVLDSQRSRGTTFAIVGFSIAAASIITSIVLFVLDRPTPPVTVSFMPTHQGGTFALSANF